MPRNGDEPVMLNEHILHLIVPYIRHHPPTLSAASRTSRSIHKSLTPILYDTVTLDGAYSQALFFRSHIPRKGRTSKWHLVKHLEITVHLSYYTLENFRYYSLSSPHLFGRWPHRNGTRHPPQISVLETFHVTSVGSPAEMIHLGRLGPKMTVHDMVSTTIANVHVLSRNTLLHLRWNAQHPPRPNPLPPRSWRAASYTPRELTIAFKRPWANLRSIHWGVYEDMVCTPVLGDHTPPQSLLSLPRIHWSCPKLAYMGHDSPPDSLYIHNYADYARAVSYTFPRAVGAAVVVPSDGKGVPPDNQMTFGISPIEWRTWGDVIGGAGHKTVTSNVIQHPKFPTVDQWREWVAREGWKDGVRSGGAS